MFQSLHSPGCLAVALFAATAMLSTNAAAGDPVVEKNPPPAPVVSDWKDHTISPVANPLFAEDPVIRTEIRPIFAYHRIDPGFITGDGDATLWALQVRYAITDRLAFIATQDGYFDINLDSGAELDGWMDIAAGFKYALIDDVANQFILTPGFAFHIPTGRCSKAAAMESGMSLSPLRRDSVIFISSRTSDSAFPTTAMSRAPCSTSA